MRIAIVLASHNRCAKTINCIASIFKQLYEPPLSVSVFLLDDASTDGTPEAVEERFPQVRVIHGTGCLFWNGAMRQGLAAALKEKFDYYVLLNDDTFLYPDALQNLILTHQQLEKNGFVQSITIGSTRDAQTGDHTYGGWRRVSRINPLKMVKVTPQKTAVQCDTLNGNCVLIPQSVIERVGNLDKAFTHCMGDLDYGFRAVKLGCTIWSAPNYVGTCSSNSNVGSWRDNNLSLAVRWNKLIGAKGLPPREWLVFTSRHGGWLWPILWANPYVKFWIKGLLRL